MISEVIQASHQQGDIIRYGRDSAGKQCTVNPYFAIIFSSIKKVSLWKSLDLGYVLKQGNTIFKRVCEDKIGMNIYEYLFVCRKT